MKNRKVKELMTSQPCTVAPDATLQEAARIMANVDCGFLPVCSKENVIGIITDRDIIIRAISRGKDPQKEKVLNYMTNECFGCHENDYLEDAAQKMHDHKVSRLIVRDHKGQVCGVLSFGGILRKNADAKEVTNIVKHATRREVA
jgi:predicted transcriptional regulator